MNIGESEVERLREVYNKEHPHEQSIPTGGTEAVWAQLQARLHAKCKSGRAECIVTSLLMRPRAPSEWKVNPEEWLSSDDIEKLERAYEKLFVGYKYVGTFPIDFGEKSETGECLISALCSMDIRAMAKQGYGQFGIVFNTDVSSGPGQHWVAAICDVRPELEYPRMTYFDSYAQSPEPEIKRLMRRWKQEWDAGGVHSKPMKLTYNKTRHQYKDSECGMYCLYFHYCCLTGVPMEERVPDDVMQGLRGLLFRV